MTIGIIKAPTAELTHHKKMSESHRLLRFDSQSFATTEYLDNPLGSIEVVIESCERWGGTPYEPQPLEQRVGIWIDMEGVSIE